MFRRALRERPRRARCPAWAFRSSSSLFGPRRLADPRLPSICNRAQAQNPLLTHRAGKDWLSTTVYEPWHRTKLLPASASPGEVRLGDRPASPRRRPGRPPARPPTPRWANLAEAIQGLVHHMRTEQQMIPRFWVDGPGRPASARSSACWRSWCAKKKWVDKAHDPEKVSTGFRTRSCAR